MKSYLTVNLPLNVNCTSDCGYTFSTTIFLPANFPSQAGEMRSRNGKRYMRYEFSISGTTPLNQVMTVTHELAYDLTKNIRRSVAKWKIKKLKLKLKELK